MKLKALTLLFLVPFFGFSIFILFAAGKAPSNEIKAIKGNPQELGLVKWERNYETALKKAKEAKKPVFILFQEVPGCSNCTRFGNDVLSNPLIVDAIEQEFIPLCIYNNKDGEDAKVLKKFNEPSWNNPVVRIINSDEKDLTIRMGDFHPNEIINGIVSSLKAEKIKVPVYVSSAQKQTNAIYSVNETVYFSMYCFWAGEVKLGGLEGVTETTSGFMKGREVVEVKFNPAVVSFETLTKKASELECTDKCFVINKKQKETASKVLGPVRVEDSDLFKPDKEVKYYLSKTAYKFVPMIPIQRIQVNIALYNGKDPNYFLSPSQISLYNKLKANSSSYKDLTQSKNIVEDWKNVSPALN